MRKNKFLTFIFSFIPGCGHMYLGYMKRGVQFMAMFAACIYLIVITLGFWAYGIDFHEIIGTFFAILLPVIWFYQIFDSMHIVGIMRRFGIEFPQDDGFFIPGFSSIENLDSLSFFKKPKVKKALALILVCAGAYIILSGSGEVIYRELYNRTSSVFRRNIYTNTYNMIRNYVPSVIISVLLIFGGVKLLTGNKKNKQDGESE